MDEPGLVARQLTRERSARKQAEILLEMKSLELYEVNQELLQLNTNLERMVEERTRKLQQLNDLLRFEINLRKGAEHNLRIYSKVLHSTGEAVVITDPAGRVIEINPAYEKAMGLTRDEVRDICA